jgi:hypothetical protein
MARDDSPENALERVVSYLEEGFDLDEACKDLYCFAVGALVEPDGVINNNLSLENVRARYNAFKQTLPSVSRQGTFAINEFQKNQRSQQVASCFSPSQSRRV